MLLLKGLENRFIKEAFKKSVVLMLVYLGVLYILIVGLARLGLEPTDFYSEKCALIQSRSIFEGRHAYGIPLDGPDTHYPQGPSYLIALMMKSGIFDAAKFRLLPFSVAIMLLLTSVTVVVFSSSRWSTKLLILASILVVHNCRGILNWMGALHEHSYAMSISLFLLIISIYVRRNIGILFFICGYVAGWIGFDFLVLNILSVFSLRFLRYLQCGRIDKTNALLYAIKETGWLASGICWAFLSHLTQNALFYQSFNVAIKDMIGAAGGRMHIESIANKLSPIYYQYMIRYSNEVNWVDKNSVASIFYTLVKVFVRGIWVNKYDKLLLLALISLWVYAMVENWNSIVQSNFIECRKRFKFNVALFLALLVLTASAWTLIMPWHTLFHYHFLPRHFFVIILAFFYSLALFDHPIECSLMKINVRIMALQFMMHLVPLLVVIVGLVRVLR